MQNVILILQRISRLDWSTLILQNSLAAFAILSTRKWGNRPLTVLTLVAHGLWNSRIEISSLWLEMTSHMKLWNYWFHSNSVTPVWKIKFHSYSVRLTPSYSLTIPWVLYKAPTNKCKTYQHWISLEKIGGISFPDLEKETFLLDYTNPSDLLWHSPDRLWFAYLVTYILVLNPCSYSSVWTALVYLMTHLGEREETQAMMWIISYEL